MAPGRLRFDFPHTSAVSPEILEAAELEANRRLARDDVINIFETTMDEAKALGATMLFGEKYGDRVRVVEVGDYSRELCGGTHVERTGNVAIIRILHEGSIGAGMRRVEALVGPDALREINAERELLRGLTDVLGVKDPAAALEHARRVIEENKRLRNELGKLRAGDRDAVIVGLVERAVILDGRDPGRVRGAGRGRHRPAGSGAEGPRQARGRSGRRGPGKRGRRQGAAGRGLHAARLGAGREGARPCSSTRPA